MFKKYLNLLAQVNELGEQVEWFFYPGMLQDAPVSWWNGFKLRNTLHEGIDICFYRSYVEKNITIRSDLNVPAMGDGQILNLCSDFLGQSIVIEHDQYKHLNNRLLFVYSHLSLMQGVMKGACLAKGEIMAQIADTRFKRSKVSGHLHLSCIEISRKISFDQLDWNLFPQRDMVTLINPIFL